MALKFELVKPTGELLELTNPYRLRDIDGLGMSPLEHRSQRGPFQHGETYLSSWLRPRTVTFSLALTGTQLSVWERRAALVALMVSLEDGFELLATLPDGSERKIALRYLRGLEMAVRQEHWIRYQPVAFQAVAHRPLWFDPDEVLWGYALEAGCGDWAFPLGFPEGFGTSMIDVVEVKQYFGTWMAFPTITVDGPITNLVIENETTDEKLDFTGYTLASGQTMTIDLRYGYKTVEREDGSSLIDKLTTDSDLGTWHIAAHPEATDGYNTIAVQGSNADLNTQISFQFYTQYAGI